MTGPQGPHQRIPCATLKEQFTARVFDELWDRYRGRVSHVATYERVVADAGAQFINDHIAFRTIATQSPFAGIPDLSRIFEALDYRAAGCYDFRDKHLNAIHYLHPNPEFPKLFISELKSWELPALAQSVIHRHMKSRRPSFSDEGLSALASLNDASNLDGSADLLDAVLREFTQRPWETPAETDIRELNQCSQYGAWVLVHGYEVNHFTALVNSHGVDSLDGIDKTVAALTAAGVPMKDQIEGAPGSKLRQSATAAAVIDVEVQRDGAVGTCPWTYAYFELAERNPVLDPETGSETRFEGFLGPQATHLFEMTKVREDKQ